MDTTKVLACLLMIAVFSQGAQIKRKTKLRSGGNIAPGAGYSQDTLEITQQRCFKTKISSRSAQEAFLKLGESVSFSELENTLEAEASVKVKLWFISAEAKAQYMRSIKDKEFSISFNYYFYATSNVVLEIGPGEEALTDNGKEYYKNGTNPFFGVTCGDQYIDSYEEGALLAMGLYIEFGSAEDKQEFYAKAGLSFKDIVTVSGSVKSLVANTNLKGKVSIEAFQMGGDPSELTKVISRDTSGNYNILSCNLDNMDSCVKAAGSLLDYATDNFSKQIKNDTNWIPLGIGFTDFKPIELLGLRSPPTFATKEVLKLREDLFDRIKENEYYQQKLHPFVNNGYPVNMSAEFLKRAMKILSKSDFNLRLLRNPVNGAIGCFKYPYMCVIIKDEIYSQLFNLTKINLSFTDNIKFYFNITSVGINSLMYNNGSYGEWDLLIPPSSSPRIINHFNDLGKNFTIEFMQISEGTTEFTCNCPASDSECPCLCTYNCVSSLQSLRVEIYRSPFFFEPFKSNQNDVKQSDLYQVNIIH